MVHRRLHIIVLEKKEKNALHLYTLTIVVSGDVRVEEKEEEEKATKYQYLAREVKRLWQLRSSSESNSSCSWGIGYNTQEVGALCGEGRNRGFSGCASESSIAWYV